MKPNFALSLSTDGIILLHRANPGWDVVGEVALDSDDLSKSLRALREAAGRISADPLRCKIVVPNDQIRYMDVHTGQVVDSRRRAIVAAALEGATPYALDELVFVTSTTGDTTQVAAVACETLEEAEAFARHHGFEPVSLVARPERGTFGGEPFFGPTRHAATLLAPGETVERDVLAIRIVGRVLPTDDAATAGVSGPLGPDVTADPAADAVQAGPRAGSGAEDLAAEAVAPDEAVRTANDDTAQPEQTPGSPMSRPEPMAMQPAGPDVEDEGPGTDVATEPAEAHPADSTRPVAAPAPNSAAEAPNAATGAASDRAEPETPHAPAPTMPARATPQDAAPNDPHRESGGASDHTEPATIRDAAPVTPQTETADLPDAPMPVFESIRATEDRLRDTGDADGGGRTSLAATFSSLRASRAAVAPGLTGGALTVDPAFFSRSSTRPTGPSAAPRIGPARQADADSPSDPSQRTGTPEAAARPDSSAPPLVFVHRRAEPPLSAPAPWRDSATDGAAGPAATAHPNAGSTDGAAFGAPRFRPAAAGEPANGPAAPATPNPAATSAPPATGMSGDVRAWDTDAAPPEAAASPDTSGADRAGPAAQPDGRAGAEPQRDAAPTSTPDVPEMTFKARRSVSRGEALSTGDSIPAPRLHPWVPGREPPAAAPRTGRSDPPLTARAGASAPTSAADTTHLPNTAGNAHTAAEGDATARDATDPDTTRGTSAGASADTSAARPEGAAPTTPAVTPKPLRGASRDTTAPAPASGKGLTATSPGLDQDRERLDDAARAALESLRPGAASDDAEIDPAPRRGLLSRLLGRHQRQDPPPLARPLADKSDGKPTSEGTSAAWAAGTVADTRPAPAGSSTRTPADASDAADPTAEADKGARKMAASAPNTDANGAAAAPAAATGKAAKPLTARSAGTGSDVAPPTGATGKGTKPKAAAATTGTDGLTPPMAATGPATEPAFDSAADARSHTVPSAAGGKRAPKGAAAAPVSADTPAALPQETDAPASRLGFLRWRRESARAESAAPAAPGWQDPGAMVLADNDAHHGDPTRDTGARAIVARLLKRDAGAAPVPADSGRVPAHAAPPHGTPAPRPHALAAGAGLRSPDRLVSDEEAMRLTVFGARGAEPDHAPGRSLPLIGLLALLFLGGAAGWAGLFGDGAMQAFVTGRDAPEAVASAAEAAPDAATSDAALPRSAASRTPVADPVADAARTAGDTADSAGTATIAALPDPSEAPQDGTERAAPGDTQAAAVPAPAGDAAEAADPAAADTARSEARYAATGIWQSAPGAVPEPSGEGLGDLVVGTSDPRISTASAVALPAAMERTDRAPVRFADPAPAGTEFDFDDRGLVRAVPDGAMSPDGVVIYAGLPARLPPARPAETLGTPEAAPGDTAPDEAAGAGTATAAVEDTPADVAAAAEDAPAAVEDTPGGAADTDAAGSGAAETGDQALASAAGSVTGGAADAPADVTPGGVALSALSQPRPQPRPEDLTPDAALPEAESGSGADSAVDGADQDAAEDVAAGTAEAEDTAAPGIGADTDAETGTEIAAVEPASAAIDDPLAALRPRLRPAEVIAAAEAQAQAEAAAAAAQAAAEAAVAAAEAAEPPLFDQATAQAVDTSRRPAERPRNFAAVVRRAQEADVRPVAAVAPVVQVPAPSVTPAVPSGASVTRQATVRNAINLRQINLIGVYGQPSSRRALVRMSDGRYKKVKVGDRIDGGRIQAIGDSDLHYVKGGRNVVLSMPKG